MKNDLDTTIEKLEKQIQYLYNDYKRLLSQHNTFYALKEIRMKIKKVEESLRLKKQIRYLSAKSLNSINLR